MSTLTTHLRCQDTYIRPLPSAPSDDRPKRPRLRSIFGTKAPRPQRTEKDLVPQSNHSDLQDSLSFNAYYSTIIYDQSYPSKPPISNTCTSNVASVDTSRHLFQDSLVRSWESKAQSKDSAKLHPFDVPEILEKIMTFLDYNNKVPLETFLARRKPLSLRHARLIYTTEQDAVKAWEESSRQQYRYTREGQESQQKPRSLGFVSQAMLVDRRFYHAAQEILYKTVYFSDTKAFEHYAGSRAAINNKSKTLILHKIQDSNQEMVNALNQSRLEHLEFFICQNLIPTRTLLGMEQQLKRLVLPGCLHVDDSFLADVAQHCRKLEVLDVRACENISDNGLVAIANSCRRIKYLNVGRMSKGCNITDKSIKAIASLTDVNTLGLAGCEVGDEAIWQIALSRGKSVERLSLNNCRRLTNAAVPHMFSLTPNLQVLELRGCKAITEVEPICDFKFRTRALVEGDEEFEERMATAMAKLKIPRI